ncbi:hypothetical protein KTQ42_02305|uniref:hypothetical protein n=1 Tax=Noviherbaspirillum sp. L7-7A TaxID=2850560 RepID=UPI001C2C8FEC|nr:hypothetical protein [Noviherbaspirillum sp. L7-7A]MBV0878136.1 hypothetical protein [Noviherbaspirillum sp. L7-7A]
MLRDLETRRSDGTAGAPFQGQVRAVPARPAPTMKFKLGAVAGGVVLLAVAAVAGQRLWQAPAPSQIATAAVAPAAAEMPQAALQAPETTPPAVVAAPVAPAVSATPAAQQEAAEVKPATMVNAPAAKTQEASEATGKVMSTVASSPAAMPAPAKPVEPTAPASNTTVATATAVAASAKPTAQFKTAAIAATPASAEPAIQATSAGNEPVARPAKRQPISPAATAAQAQGRNEEAPLQQAAAAASTATTPTPPAAEPLKIVRETLPQADMAMQLARQQLQDNALREAIDTLQRALPQAGARADYHAFLAALLQRDDQHRSAAEHYATALRSAPDNGVWWMGLGISYQALQMATQAQQAYRSAQASRTLSPELAAFVEARLGQLQRP